MLNVEMTMTRVIRRSIELKEYTTVAELKTLLTGVGYDISKSVIRITHAGTETVIAPKDSYVLSDGDLVFISDIDEFNVTEYKAKRQAEFERICKESENSDSEVSGVRCFFFSARF